MNNNWKHTSIETSQELDRLGLKVESEWYWRCYTLDNNERFPVLVRKSVVATEKRYAAKTDWIIGVEIYPAPDCAELGRLLPFGVQTWKRFKNNHKPQEYYKCHYQSGNVRYDCDVSTEAEARGKTLIWLIKNKYIDIEELNNIGKK